MSKEALARVRMGPKALGMAAALSLSLMAMAAHADMQSGVASLGGAKLPADIQYKGLPGAPQIATLLATPQNPASSSSASSSRHQGHAAFPPG